MTEYPVQCFDNNGEPYGRYLNPNPEYKYSSDYQKSKIYQAFEMFSYHNTFPFPSGTIGKTYERDEVEILYQYFAELNGITDWIDCDQRWYDTMNKNSVCPTRAMFCLPQPVEKEPETVELTEYRKITGFNTPEERKAYEEGRDDEQKVLIDFIRNWKGATNSGLGEILYNKFIDWQKQQSK